MLLLAALLGLMAARSAMATPILALLESDNCGGCHKPGRTQKPFLDRRCTLDCQGCHVDPDGAGPRNQWGYYYEQDQLTSARFFSPEDPLEDQSRLDVHYDGRIITQELDQDQHRTFPMASELSLRVRPFVKYLSLMYQSLLLGQVGDQSLRAVRSDRERYREKYSAMVDNLPLDTYVRAYRGTPLYGQRWPNHTLWIRERLGLDDLATTDAVEVGGTPNVPYLRGSYMKGDPYARPEDQQVGTSWIAGLRGVTLGWNVNGGGWETSSEKASINMRYLAAGLRPGKFFVMAERNWRDVEWREPPVDQADWSSQALMLWPSSEITQYTAGFGGIRGVIIGSVLETLHDAQDDSLRRSVFMDFHPIPFLQFEVWRRMETGTRRLADTLAVGHLYFDF